MRLDPFHGRHGDAAARSPEFIPPFRRGVGVGDIDCRELQVGSTLYLPVPVPGALFSVGDGHALQGDGEVSGLALGRVRWSVIVLRFGLESSELAMPRARTAAGWITFGFHEDLDEAAAIALEGMLDLMTEQFGGRAQDGDWPWRAWR